MGSLTLPMKNPRLSVKASRFDVVRNLDLNTYRLECFKRAKFSRVDVGSR